jgi:hypothetical protein
MELTMEEIETYAGLERKRESVEDAVTGVAQGLCTGLFLWGGGGTSKSYTVAEVLRRRRVPFHIHNSISGRSLIDELSEHRDDIHVIEDVESLLKDSIGRRVLRSALWSQSKAKPMRRRVTHKVHRVNIRFIFRGAIIIISNQDLGNSAIEQAIATRIDVLHMKLTPSELLVLMKVICQDGFKFGRDRLRPAECAEIAEFIRAESCRLNRDLDIRLLLKAFKYRLQWRSGDSKNHWKDRVRAQMLRTVAIRYRTRREVTAEEAAIAMEIYNRDGLTGKQKIAVWNEGTGKSQGAYYRALRRFGG